MSGLTRSCPSASWHRGRGSRAPGVRVDVVQSRLVGVPPGESVGGYDDLPDSSHGHPLHRGRGDRCKRCPSALCVTCLCSGEGSQGPSYDSQKPFSSLAEVIEHIPFLLFNLFVYRENSYGKLPLKGNQGEREARIRKPGRWLAFLWSPQFAFTLREKDLRLRSEDGLHSETAKFGFRKRGQLRA